MSAVAPGNSERQKVVARYQEGSAATPVNSFNATPHCPRSPTHFDTWRELWLTLACWHRNRYVRVRVRWLLHLLREWGVALRGSLRRWCGQLCRTVDLRLNGWRLRINSRHTLEKRRRLAFNTITGATRLKGGDSRSAWVNAAFQVEIP